MALDFVLQATPTFRRLNIDLLSLIIQTKCKKCKAFKKKMWFECWRLQGLLWTRVLWYCNSGDAHKVQFVSVSCRSVKAISVCPVPVSSTCISNSREASHYVDKYNWVCEIFHWLWLHFFRECMNEVLLYNEISIWQSGNFTDENISAMLFGNIFWCC